MRPENATGTSLLRMEVVDGIVHIGLDRPPSNEMTGSFFDELSVLVTRLENTASFRGIIISGTGRHFSSGAALDELLSAIKINGGDLLTANRRSMEFFADAEVPVVAAVRGVCLGSAFEWALLCHFRICTEDAVFGLPESTFNLMPGLGGTGRIAALAGDAKALELVLRGRTFSAAEALELGLVDRLVPKKELLSSAISLINSVSPGYRKEKRVLYLNRYLKHHVTLNDASV
jgi:enoyl-CoA hydratase/carnithine racemase